MYCLHRIIDEIKVYKHNTQASGESDLRKIQTGYPLLTLFNGRDSTLQSYCCHRTRLFSQQQGFYSFH